MGYDNNSSAALNMADYVEYLLEFTDAESLKYALDSDSTVLYAWIESVRGGTCSPCAAQESDDLGSIDYLDEEHTCGDY